MKTICINSNKTNSSFTKTIRTRENAVIKAFLIILLFTICNVTKTRANDPFGSFDGIVNGSVIRGWAFDPDCPNTPITFHIYNGACCGDFVGAVTANNIFRPDVASAYGISNQNTGFEIDIANILCERTGTLNLHLYALNACGAGGNPLVGNHSITLGKSGGSISVSSVNVCNNGTVTLNSITPGTLTGFNASGLRYTWYRRDELRGTWTAIPGQSNTTNASITDNPGPGKYYYLRRTHHTSCGVCHQAACTDAASASVSVDIPNPSIPPIAGNNVLCIGQQTTFSLSNLPTGGTISNVDGYRLHTFTSGTSTFSAPSNWNADVLVIAGGGGGGGVIGGGGGAGGVRIEPNFIVAAGDNTVVVGAGGIGGTGWNTATQQGGKGGNSQFGTIIAEGGGGGGVHGGASAPQTNAWNGGSGGGGGTGSGGSGVTGQGFSGGVGGGNNGGGGGGAGAVGGNSSGTQACCTGGIAAGNGGNGIWLNYNNTPTWYAGGGGGGTRGTANGSAGSGGLGGGGNGTNTTTLAASGAPNTGGGGGGGGYSGDFAGQVGGNGGAGIVMVRYPNVTTGTWSSSNPTVADVNSAGAVTANQVGTANIIFTYTSPGGCQTSISREIIVTQIPAVPVVLNNGPVCEGEVLELTASGLAPGGQSLDLSVVNTSNMLVSGGIPIGSNWTLETWFQYPLSATADWSTLFRGPNHHHVIVQKTTGLLGVFDNGGGGFRPSGFNMSALTSGWHHISAVGSGTTTKFYINGNLVGESDFKPNTDIVSIGHCCGGTGSQQWGVVDNIRIWNVAKTQNEIVQEMFLETPTNSTGLVAHYPLNGNANCVNNASYNATTNGSYPGVSYFTYEWSGTGAPAASTNETQTTTTASTGNYTVVASRAGFCTSPASAPTAVTVNLLSTANAGAATNICESPSPTAITLTGASVGGGASTGAWSIQSGGGTLSSTAQESNPAAVTYTPAANFSGPVVLRLTTDAGNCGAVFSEITITINPLSTVDAGTSLSAICQGGTSVQLGGSVGGGATSGTWNDGGVGGAFSPNASDVNATWTPPANYHGTATLTLTTDAGFCGAVSAQKTQVVNPLPVITSQPQPLTLCQGTTGSFSISSTGASTFQWQYSDGANWININDVIGEIEGSQTQTLQVLSANVFYNNRNIRCVATTALSCSAASDGALFTVQQFSAAGTVTGAPTDVCEGSNVTYGTSGTLGTFNRFEFQWNGTGGTWQTLSTSNPFNWTAIDAGNTIFVRSVVTNGLCPTAFSLPVETFVKFPTPAQPNAIVKNGLDCTGDQSYSINAVANATTYTWTGSGSSSLLGGQGTTSASFNFPSAGAYTLSVTAENSCGVSPVRTVNLNIAPTLTPTISIVSGIQLVNVCDGTQATFTGTPFHQGTTPTYQWKINGNNVGSNSLTFVSTTLNPFDIITLELTSSEVCVTSATATSNFLDVVCDMVCEDNNTLKATFNAGQDGLTGSVDVYEVSIDNGNNWSSYVPNTPIITTGGSGSILVRAQRRGPNGSGCDAPWNTYKIRNFWQPTVAPDLDSYLPSGSEICETNTDGSLSFFPGLGGPLDAADEYLLNIGLGWTTYNIGDPISLINGTGTAQIRAIRNGGSDGCKPDTADYNLWSIVSPETGLSHVPVNGDYIWTGYIGNNWSNPRNFIVYNGSNFSEASTLPASNNNVLIPETMSSICYVNNTSNVDITGTTNTITIANGATLEVVGSNVLDIHGNWINEGTFNSTSGVVNFIGSNNATVNAGGNNGKFYHVNINKSNDANTVVFTEDFEATHKVDVTKGELIVETNVVGKAKKVELKTGATKLNIQSQGQLRVNE